MTTPTLFKQIEHSSYIDDLDDAIRPIQDILGQDDGGVASHFFSGPNGDAWPEATNAWRRAILTQYINYELALNA